jgi:hypothetical protein
MIEIPAVLGAYASRWVLAGTIAASLTGFSTDGLIPAVARATADGQTPAKTEAMAPGQKLTVAFSDPAKPGLLKVNLVAGGVKVVGYEGKDVIIEVRDADTDDERESPRTPGGMRRIPNRSLGLVVEEERNEMRIGSSMPNKAIALSVQVPTHTSLKISTVNDGDITVERVDGDIEVNNVNGAVTLTNVSGTVVAHALNEDLKASIVRMSDKPMSFSSLNGNLDITLPASLKADVRMETSNGEMYTDFPIDMQPATVTSKTADDRGKGGKYRLEIDKAMVGKVGGGGPEIRFKTFNGDIKLHKGS